MTGSGPAGGAAHNGSPAFLGSASRIDVLLDAARARLPHRPTPDELAAVAAAGGLVVDIRAAEQRRRHGPLPGALVVERSVLEWRLDPTSPHRIAGLEVNGRAVVLVCREGYSSSLAAATLQRLGIAGATDLDGGYDAWSAWLAGGGTVAPDRGAPHGGRSGDLTGRRGPLDGAT